MRRVWLVVGALIAAVVGEVWLLALAVQHLGLGWTLALLLGTAVVGGLLWRREGLKAWRSLVEAPPEPDAVGVRVTDAALVLIGGVLLLLPGFGSDVLGLMCLLPPTRAVARRGVRAVVAGMTRPYRDRADLIDLRLRPDTVVPGQAVPDADLPRRSPRPGDPDVIRGEIEG